MSDFVYLALTLISFAGLALLVGAIDTRLSARDPGPDPDPDSGPGSAAPVESTGPDRAGRAVPR